MLLWIWIILGVLALLVLGISFACYCKAFYAKTHKPPQKGSIWLPKGKIYEPFYPMMRKWAKETWELPQERFCIKSYDGLNLYGTYYEYAPGAPMELMFHGYRGLAQSDLSGGVQRSFKLGRSCLLVDQRCCGESQGHTITFGIREHRDCLSWIQFVREHFGPDVKIILTGISMGAATVLMAAGEPLPDNVIGVLADCGYSTPKAIIQEVIRQMKLPVKLSYPFVYLGARIFGRFDLHEASPLEAIKNCKVPVIFFHGEADDFVPCDMSREVYEACPTRKKLVTVPGAGHGLSLPIDQERYLKELGDFFGTEGSALKDPE